MIEDVSYFRRTVVRQILMLLFWISGFSVAVSALVWVRLFKILFGSTLFISSSVITILLLGISIGSYYFGKKADYYKNELSIFMQSELAIGASSLLLLLFFSIILALAKLLVEHTAPESPLFAIFQIITLLIFLLPPSVLVGATLSSLSRFFIEASHRVSREIGNLISIKLFGIAVGCLLSGFFFIPVFGVRQSLLLAIIFNLLTVLLLRFLINQSKATITIETEFFDQQLKHLTASKNASPQLLKHLVLFGIGGSGCIIFSYLILWMRSLIMSMGDDTYSSLIMIIVFALALAFGAMLFSRVIKDGRNPVIIFAVVEILVGLFGILSVVFIPSLASLNQVFGFFSSSAFTWSDKIFINFFNASFIIFIPAYLVGTTFPLVGKIILADYEERGRVIGSMVAFFAIGGIIGIHAMNFLFIPNIGIQKSVIFLALIAFLLGLIVLFFSSFHYRWITKTIIVFGSVITLFLLSFLIPANLIRASYEKSRQDGPMIYVNEAQKATITVHQIEKNLKLMLATNGADLSGTTHEWLTCERMLGHLPLVLHPNPDAVLTFGFRSGETAKSILSHPVKQVDCTENIEEIVDASTLLNSNRDDLLSHSTFRMLPVDGANYNLLMRAKYDIIINNLVHPAFDDNARFYTLNHFLACKDHLKSGGLMATGAPLFRMSIEDFKILLHSFQTAFPATTLWYVNNSLSPYALLIGSADPEFRIDYGIVEARLKNPAVMTNLSRIGMDNIYEILDCFILGSKTIASLTEETQLHKNNAPHLEFSTPKVLDLTTNWGQIFQLMAGYRESVYPFLVNTGTNRDEEKLVKAIVENYYLSSEHTLNALSLELLGKPEIALSFYRQVLMTNRFDRGAKRFFDSYYDSLLVAAPETPAQFTENASVYFQKMEHEEAINLLLKAIALKPDYAPAYFALGINYEIIGEFETAKNMYQRTLKLKPDLQQVKDRLDSLSVKMKQQKSKK